MVVPAMQWLVHCAATLRSWVLDWVEISVSVALLAHSAVMSRPGFYFVEGEAARE